MSITQAQFLSVGCGGQIEVWHDSGEPEPCAVCNGTGLEYESDTCEECTGSGTRQLVAGWYYWHCLPGCLPESDEIGPFSSVHTAVSAAKEQCDDHCDAIS